MCDICGDAGREDLLAICSRCSDGAEHTYVQDPFILPLLIFYHIFAWFFLAKMKLNIIYE